MVITARIARLAATKEAGVDVALVAFPAGSTSFLQAELKEADEDGNLEEEELVDEERCL